MALFFVSGKGGVGKTSMSLALATLFASQGRKTLIAEINSEEQVARLLERDPIGHEETLLLPNLWGINVRPRKSFEEYVLMQIKFKSLYKVVFENRFVRHFIDATPGLADLMSIGKIYSLVDSYDTVIVDAPATGHGIALLKIASIVSSAVKVGPLKTESQKIDDLLKNHDRTRVVLVTLPEEMPVTEAVEMVEALKAYRLSVVFLNQYQEKIMSDEEWKTVGKYFGDPAHQQSAELLDFYRKRQELSAHYRNVLDEKIKEPVLPIPIIYSPQFGLAEIQEIAEEMERHGIPQSL